MDTEEIKGSCEYCGFQYQGEVMLHEGSFPEIRCPRCGHETQNFDNAIAVDFLDRAEGRILGYEKVASFELVA